MADPETSETEPNETTDAVAPAPKSKKTRKAKRPRVEDVPAPEADAEADAPPAAKPRDASAPRRAPTPPAPPPAKGWPKDVVVFGMILSALLGVLFVDVAPRLSPGMAQVFGKATTVELTLVATDDRNLACASAAEPGGLRCAFDGDGKQRPGVGPSGADVLQPYTTTDRKQILAAGLWGEPAMARAGLPKERFKVRCELEVVGEVASPKVRWKVGEFTEAKGTWRAGRLSKCALVPG